MTLATTIWATNDLVPGDVEIEVLESTFPFNPIHSAAVTLVDAAGVTHAKTTAANGKVLFGYVPQGSINYSISRTDYVFDTSTYGYGSWTVAPDQTNHLTIRGHIAASALVTVRSTDTTPIAAASVEVDGDKSPPRFFQTASDGTVEFDGLLIDRYVLTTTATGYQTTQTIFVIDETNYEDRPTVLPDVVMSP